MTRVHRLARAGLAGVAVCASIAGCRERAERFSVAPGANGTFAFSFTGPTSVTFDWRGTGNSMSIWSKDSPPHDVPAHTPSPLPFSASGPWKEATVTGLEPGMEYGYEITPDGAGSAIVDTLDLRAPFGLVRFAASRARSVQVSRARILAERLGGRSEQS